MAYRILLHEKSSDNIRIGKAFEYEMSEDEVLGLLVSQRRISFGKIGKYWSRIAIVDADTLAVVTTVYSE